MPWSAWFTGRENYVVDQTTFAVFEKARFHRYGLLLFSSARSVPGRFGIFLTYLNEVGPVQDAAQRLHLTGQKVEPQGKGQEPVAAPSGPSHPGGETGSQPSGPVGTAPGAEDVGTQEAEGGTGHKIQELLHQFGEKMGLVHHGEKSHEGTVKTVQS
jgi:hypothetical protein